MRIAHHMIILAIAACLGLASMGLATALMSERQHGDQLETKLRTANAAVAKLSSRYCSKVLPETLTAGTTSIREYEDRSYRLHLPEEFEYNQRYPLLLAFDGMDGSAAHMERYSALDALPAIVVYPEPTIGTNGMTSWQGAPYSSASDDVQFVRDIIEELQRKYCIDQARIFAVGMSNGGGFVTLAACELGDKLRAVASISGAYYTPCTRRVQLPSLLAVHSTDDRQVPFSGSAERKLPSVRAWAQTQASARDCTIKPFGTYEDGPLIYRWSGCDNSTNVELLVVNKQHHGWLYAPQSNNKPPLDMARFIWRFFERQ